MTRRGDRSERQASFPEGLWSPPIPNAFWASSCALALGSQVGLPVSFREEDFLKAYILGHIWWVLWILCVSKGTCWSVAWVTHVGYAGPGQSFQDGTPGVCASGHPTPHAVFLTLLDVSVFVMDSAPSPILDFVSAGLRVLAGFGVGEWEARMWTC